MRLIRPSARIASLGCVLASWITLDAWAGDTATNSLLLQFTREQDAETPGTAFRAYIDAQLHDIPGIGGVSAVLGNGTVVTLSWIPEDERYWARLDFGSFAGMQAAIHGTWTIAISGDSPSTSTFVVNADALQDSDFFECPIVLTPAQGEVDVSPNVVFAWLAPGDGPYPVYVVNPYVDNMEFGPGPAAVVRADATEWDPPSCLLPGSTRFGLSYINAIASELVSPLTVVNGRVEWTTSDLAPRGYPAHAPLIGLSGETRQYFSVAERVSPADLDCNGAVNAADLALLLGAWGGPAGDANGDGTTNAADLATLLGAWTG